MNWKKRMKRFLMIIFLSCLVVLTGFSKKVCEEDPPENSADNYAEIEEYINNYVNLKENTQIEGYEWIAGGGSECLRIRVGYIDVPEDTYAHKEDYFIFVDSDEVVQVFLMSYENKNIGYACDFYAYFEDVTFDGKPDLLISLGGVGVHGTPYYTACIYRNGAYEYEKSFEEIPDYEVLTKQEMIKGKATDSADQFHESYYQYQDDQFVIVKNHSYIYLDGSEDALICLSPDNIINFKEVFEHYFDRRNRIHVRRDVSEAEEYDTGIFPKETAKVLFSLNNNSTYDDEYYQTFAPRFGASAGSEYAYYDHNTSLEDLPKEIRSYILDDSKEYLDTSIRDIQQADIDGDGDPEWVIRKNYFTRFFSDFIEIYKYTDIDIHDETVNWNAKNLCPDNIGYQTFEQNGTLELLSKDGEYYVLSHSIISHVSDKNTDWSEIASSTMPTETAAWDILMLDRQVTGYDAYEIYSDDEYESDALLDDIDLFELCKKDNLKNYGVWWCEDEWYSMKSQSVLTQETGSKNYYYTLFKENEPFFGEKADRVLAVLRQTEDGQMEIVKLYYLIAKISLDVLPMNGEDYKEYKFEDYRLVEEPPDMDTTVHEVWCRTDVASYEFATMTISNFEAGKSFDVEIVANYSIYGGVIEGSAEFTDEDHAELKLEMYDGDVCTVYFQFVDESILVEHDDRLRYVFGGGGIGTAEGRYTKQEPEYTNCTDVSEIFTEEELEEIREMLQGSYQYLFENGIERGEIEEFEVSGGRLLKAAWPPSGVAWCNILIYDDGRIYIQGQSYTSEAEKKYYTNCDDTELPNEEEFQIRLFGW